MILGQKPPQRYQREAIDCYVAGLPEEAPLRDIVTSEAVQAKLAEFEAADDEAVKHQNHYRISGRTALWATTASTLIGAVLLLPIEKWLPAVPRGIAGLLQTLALIITFVAIRWISNRKYVDRWMASRAQAERMRGDVFRAILEAPPPPGATAESLNAEKHKLIVACHVNDQLGYYDSRERKHLNAASSMTPFRIVGYVLSGLAILLGLMATVQVAVELRFAVPSALQGIAQIFVNEGGATRLQLCLGTIASCLLAHGSAKTLMDQDERNAALYRRTAAKICEVLARYEESVGTADAATLRAWYTDVRRAMQEEHGAWRLARPRSDPREEPDHRVAKGVQ